MNYKYREKFSHYLQRSPFDQMEQSVSNFCTQLYPVIQIRLRRRIEIIHSDIRLTFQSEDIGPIAATSDHVSLSKVAR